MSRSSPAQSLGDATSAPTSAVDLALQQLSRGRLRRRVPGIGFVYIERPLPFLCVYRLPRERRDAGTAKLVTCFPCYFVGERRDPNEHDVARAVERLAFALRDLCGAVLLLEVWSGTASERAALEPEPPHFRLLAPADPELDAIVDAFTRALEKLELEGTRASVEVYRGARAGQREHPAINLGGTAHVFGLEVAPVYREADGTTTFPIVLAKLRRALDAALRQGFFAFAKRYTQHPPAHPHSLGRRILVKAARDVDQRLTNVSASLEYLLLVTPTNAREAWHEFQRSRCEQAPHFRYRPLRFDPELSKRRLYDVHLERIEDPTLTVIFREKQEELDQMITMLRQRNTPHFLWGSMQIFGGVDRSLHQLALEILARSNQERMDQEPGELIGAERFAELAREELEHYRAAWPELVPKICVRPDVPSLMVLNGELVVGSEVSLELSRARALIQHEVGTHLVTYYNGRAQRLQHLSSGFAGYESLQEGLAVLAEYLSGGLSITRLRLIASRVVAVKCLLEGATFVDTFRELCSKVGLGAHAAFTVCMRVYRSGGLTKDAIYLRGLEDVLGHLAEGGELEELFVGKIAIAHVPLVRELRLRGMLKKPRLLPRYLQDENARSRLAELRAGASVLDLLKE